MKRKWVLCAWILAAVFAMGQQKQQSRPVISRLEIYDVNTKERTVIRQFIGRIEAPNWTPDGKFLVYNSNGLLYRIPVQGGEPEQINTGTIRGCNNDHLISADGNLLAFSARGPAGSSQVFVLPFTGGEPRLVTPLAPSYLHGISPDNKQLAYCANRNGNFDVYVIPTNGGQENRLTDAPGLDDGPEYSPDGKYIWFNSVRTGLMQAWRMKVDGSEQTQMTMDEANTWFPHVSPDGKFVVMIAYYKGDVDPSAHPADKNVELRLMPAAGGKAETIIKLFGGQGTLNVNSWSPDSRRFAFVSFELAK
jgi:TolB protein